MGSKENLEEKNDLKMREEYDFSNGVRGKHHNAYRNGHTVTIHNEDGSVMLDPDIRIHFPDSESVNRALRSLIQKEAAEGP
jgi:hypothetical protein